MVLVKVPIMKGYSSIAAARAKHKFDNEKRLLKEKVRILSGLGIVASIGLAIILVCII